MKTKNKLAGLLILLALTFSVPFDTMAQRHGHGGPPPWAPAHGYRAQVRHVYFPEYNFYYDVQREMYIYMAGGNWLFSVSLPLMFARVDLPHAQMVELELYNDRPFIYNNFHREKYARHHHDDHYVIIDERDHRHHHRDYYERGDHRNYYDKGDHKEYNDQNDHGKNYKNHDKGDYKGGNGNRNKNGNRNGNGNGNGNGRHR